VSVLANLWNGENYRQNSQAQENWAKPIIEQLHLQGTERILDIGCGDGKLTKKLAILVPQGEVIGLDQSQSMLDAANKLVDETVSGRLSFVLGDATNFNLGKIFDVITSFTALHWVHDHASVIYNAARHLDVGGRIYFLLPLSEHCTQFIETKKAMKASPKYAELIGDFDTNMVKPSLDAYLPMLLGNGFRVDLISLQLKPAMFDSREQMFGWLKAWIFVEYRMIPPEKREEFVKDFLDTYLRQPGAVDAEGRGLWNVHFVELMATLTKAT
jgi:trans-aconitate 2-methyltransferase